MKRFRGTHRYQLESLESRRLLTTYTVDLGTLGYASGDFEYNGKINAASDEDDSTVGAHDRSACHWNYAAALRFLPPPFLAFLSFLTMPEASPA